MLLEYTRAINKRVAAPECGVEVCLKGLASRMNWGQVVLPHILIPLVAL